MFLFANAQTEDVDGRNKSGQEHKAMIK